MKQKHSLCFAAALLAAASAFGAPVSPQRALEIARDFERSATARKMMRAPASKGVMAQVFKYADKASGMDAIFVFNRGTGDGYVMVSGDDRAPLVLGYSDKGSFNAASMPDNMMVMFENWGHQIAWLATHDDARSSVPMKVSREVSPLLGEIAWDQTDPYNRKCPTVAQADEWGEISGSGPAATGCVATALGQIMYYHQWPPQGTGSVSYVSHGTDPDGDREDVNVSVTFDGTQYNWSAMLPSLTSKSPSDAIDAVSTLLFHVGASFESIYGMSTGATDISVAPALMKYFNYDKGINYLKRDFFTTEEWNDILINELENNRPVAYGGVTRRLEGHFFVLDGVNTDGYYHVNWGWSGSENGYYLLTLLEPGVQGTGGASGGAFHYEQNMITGIQKPVEGSDYNYNFTCEEVNSVNATVGRQETVTLKASGVWNDSPNAVTANLGFILVDSQGNTVYRQMVKNEVNYGVAYGEQELSCSFLIPDNIPAGDYTIRPAYQLSTDNYSSDRLMQVMPAHLSQYNVTITENNITYASTGAYSLTLLEVRGDNEGDLENGVTKTITVKVHNDGGEFFGPIQLRMFINGQERTFGRFDFPSSATKAEWRSIPGHADSELTFDVGSFDVPGYDDYVVRLWGNEGTFETDEDGYTSTRKAKNLCSVKGVKVVGPALPPVVEVVDDMIVTTAVDGVVPRNDVGLKVCISNEGGEWSGHLRCSVKDPDTWSRDPLGYVDFTNTVTLAAATEEQWILLTGGEMPEACETGKLYELTILEPDKDEAMVPSYYVTTEVTVGEAVEKISQLTMDEVTFYPEPVGAGVPTDVQFHVSNTGYPYYGQMYFKVARNGETLHTSARRDAAVERDDEAYVAFEETFELPTAADYVVTLFDGQDNEIGKKENVSFAADEPALSLTDETVIPEVINCNQETDYVFGVRNDGFRFDSTLRFAILLEGEEKFSSQPQEVSLSRGGNDTVTFHESINIPNGENYIVRLLDGERTVGERSGIKVYGYVGMGEISSAQVRLTVADGMIHVSGIEAADIAVYTVDGRLAAAADGRNSLDISGLSNGAYIVTVRTADLFRTFKFVK